MARLPVWPPAVLRIKSIQVYHHVTYTMFQCANICNAHGPATRRKGRDADFARPRLFARAQRGVSRVPVAGPQVLLGRTAPAGRTQVVVGLLWLCIRSLFSPMRTWCGRRNRTHISLCRCRHPIWQTHTYTHTQTEPKSAAGTHIGTANLGASARESMLFTGTQFSNLYSRIGSIDNELIRHSVSVFPKNAQGGSALQRILYQARTFCFIYSRTRP